jgi:hypothetical protein
MNVTQPDQWIYGMQLPVQTLTRTLVDPWEDAASVDDLVQIAQRCETNGHSFVGVCDHIAVPDNEYASRMTTTWYDTIATLSYLAAQTESVRLLSAVWIAACWNTALHTRARVRSAVARCGDRRTSSQTSVFWCMRSCRRALRSAITVTTP